MSIKRICLRLGWLLLFVCLIWLTTQTSTATSKQRTVSSFPVAQTVWKIELNDDALYRLTYADLEEQGMLVDDVDPRNFALLWRGQSVAYQFEGDSDGQFEAGESLLFYGWWFNESRETRQYVKTNVFWLVEDGVPASISSQPNVTTHQAVQSVFSEITAEPENTFSLTGTRHWKTFPNGFDSWYWAAIEKSAEISTTHSFTITLPHPLDNGNDASTLVELLNQDKGAHDVTIALNDHPATQYLWSGKVNTNLEQTLPASVLANGTNTVTLALNSSNRDSFLLNRITTTYERELTVDDGSLQFKYPAAGDFSFALNGLPTTSNGLHFWDISLRTQPTAIDPTGSYDAGAGLHRFGGTFSADAHFIVSDDSAIRTPDRISPYVGPDLMPQNGAEWLAISHSSLLTETVRLADWRSAHSRLATHVVDVDDVINQYGWGLPIPDHIRDYLIDAVETWPTAPDYLLLAGNASLNPRQLACQSNCYSTWTTSEPTLVPTWLEPTDRTMGLVPIDHHYSTLTGDDDQGDIAIGRLPAENMAQLSTMVDKIITYETNLISAETWMQNMLFVSDDTDGAGNFCKYNNAHIAEYDSSYNKTHYCLDDTDIGSLRSGMFDSINDGVLMAHYLGHGTITGWASEGILSNQDGNNFTNADKPFVQISGNCLDGHYAWVGMQSISETMMSMGNGGSVAHWGNSGLGYLLEHQIMHLAFTEATEEHGITRIGDAVNFAKNAYLDLYFYAPQAYSSVLMADPAMQLFHPELEAGLGSDVDLVDPGQEVTFSALVTNTGLIDSPATLTYTVPAWVTIDNAYASDGSTITVNSAESQVIMQAPVLALGDSARLSVTVRVLSWETPADFTASITSTGEGFEADLSNNSAETTVHINSFSPTSITIANQQTISQSHLTLTGSAIALVCVSLLTLRRRQKS